MCIEYSKNTKTPCMYVKQASKEHNYYRFFSEKTQAQLVAQLAECLH